MIRYTFPKDMRLSSKKEIDKLFLEGNTFVSGPFRVFYSLYKPEQPVSSSSQAVPSSSQPVPSSSQATPSSRQPISSSCRIAFSVSKKRLKSAVQRNKVKRRLREAFRLQYPHVLKQVLEQSNHVLLLLCIYLPHEIKPWDYTEKKMGILLSYFSDICQKNIESALDSDR